MAAVFIQNTADLALFAATVVATPLMAYHWVAEAWQNVGSRAPLHPITDHVSTYYHSNTTAITNPTSSAENSKTNASYDVNKFISSTTQNQASSVIVVTPSMTDTPTHALPTTDPGIYEKEENPNFIVFATLSDSNCPGTTSTAAITDPRPARPPTAPTAPPRWSPIMDTLDFISPYYHAFIVTIFSFIADHLARVAMIRSISSSWPYLHFHFHYSCEHENPFLHTCKHENHLLEFVLPIAFFGACGIALALWGCLHTSRRVKVLGYGTVGTAFVAWAWLNVRSVLDFGVLMGTVGYMTALYWIISRHSSRRATLRPSLPIHHLHSTLTAPWKALSPSVRGCVKLFTWYILLQLALRTIPLLQPFIDWEVSRETSYLRILGDIRTMLRDSPLIVYLGVPGAFCWMLWVTFTEQPAKLGDSLWFTPAAGVVGNQLGQEYLGLTFWIAFVWCVVRVVCPDWPFSKRATWNTFACVGAGAFVIWMHEHSRLHDLFTVNSPWYFSLSEMEQFALMKILPTFILANWLFVIYDPKHGERLLQVQLWTSSVILFGQWSYSFLPFLSNLGKSFIPGIPIIPNLGKCFPPRIPNTVSASGPVYQNAIIFLPFFLIPEILLLLRRHGKRAGMYGSLAVYFCIWYASHDERLMPSRNTWARFLFGVSYAFWRYSDANYEENMRHAGTPVGHPVYRAYKAVGCQRVVGKVNKGYEWGVTHVLGFAGFAMCTFWLLDWIPSLRTVLALFGDQWDSIPAWGWVAPVVGSLVSLYCIQWTLVFGVVWTGVIWTLAIVARLFAWVFFRPDGQLRGTGSSKGGPPGGGDGGGPPRPDEPGSGDFDPADDGYVPPGGFPESHEAEETEARAPGTGPVDPEPAGPPTFVPIDDLLEPAEEGQTEVVIEPRPPGLDRAEPRTTIPPEPTKKGMAEDAGETKGPHKIKNETTPNEDPIDANPVQPRPPISMHTDGQIDVAKGTQEAEEIEYGPQLRPLTPRKRLLLKVVNSGADMARRNSISKALREKYGILGPNDISNAKTEEKNAAKPTQAERTDEKVAKPKYEAKNNEDISKPNDPEKTEAKLEKLADPQAKEPPSLTLAIYPGPEEPKAESGSGDSDAVQSAAESEAAEDPKSKNPLGLKIDTEISTSLTRLPLLVPEPASPEEVYLPSSQARVATAPNPGNEDPDSSDEERDGKKGKDHDRKSPPPSPLPIPASDKKAMREALWGKSALGRSRRALLNGGNNAPGSGPGPGPGGPPPPPPGPPGHLSLHLNSPPPHPQPAELPPPPTGPLLPLANPTNPATGPRENDYIEGKSNAVNMAGNASNINNNTVTAPLETHENTGVDNCDDMQGIEQGQATGPSQNDQQFGTPTQTHALGSGGLPTTPALITSFRPTTENQHNLFAPNPTDPDVMDLDDLETSGQAPLQPPQQLAPLVGGAFDFSSSALQPPSALVVLESTSATRGDQFKPPAINPSIPFSPSPIPQSAPPLSRNFDFSMPIKNPLPQAPRNKIANKNTTFANFLSSVSSAQKTPIATEPTAAAPAHKPDTQSRPSAVNPSPNEDIVMLSPHANNFLEKTGVLPTVQPTAGAPPTNTNPDKAFAQQFNRGLFPGNTSKPTTPKSAPLWADGTKPNWGSVAKPIGKGDEAPEIAIPGSAEIQTDSVSELIQILGPNSNSQPPTTDLGTSNSHTSKSETANPATNADVQGKIDGITQKPRAIAKMKARTRYEVTQFPVPGLPETQPGSASDILKNSAPTSTYEPALADWGFNSENAIKPDTKQRRPTPTMDSIRKPLKFKESKKPAHPEPAEEEEEEDPMTEAFNKVFASMESEPDKKNNAMLPSDKEFLGGLIGSDENNDRMVSDGDDAVEEVQGCDDVISNEPLPAPESAPNTTQPPPPAANIDLVPGYGSDSGESNATEKELKDINDMFNELDRGLEESREKDKKHFAEQGILFDNVDVEERGRSTDRNVTRNSEREDSNARGRNWSTDGRLGRDEDEDEGEDESERYSRFR